MEILGSILTFLIDTIGSFGYLGILLVVGLEYACFPLPSEVVLTFLGLSAAQGEFSFAGVLIFSIIGGILGSLICYAIGFYGGVPLQNWLAKKLPSSQKSMLALNKWFKKYGKPAVLLARIVPLTRTYVSLLAGAENFSLKYFITYSTIGIALWNTVLVSLGYFIGDNLELINSIMEKYTFATIGIIILSIIIFLYFKFYKKNKNK
ncbi:DedA family protein [Clostridium sp. B9]|uniref:DedA family protein n=1 Tax=Clostridium sp. B9 TaxID=3423224 RepID=UPI003D2F318E